METLKSTLCGLAVGTPLGYRNLTLVPLLSEKASTGMPFYQTLDEAVVARTARVSEVSTEGCVPELRFENTGDRPVLILDGEELLGARQNRTVNVTILAPAHSSLTLPVTCVEAGRWHPTSAAFMPANRLHFRSGRIRKMQQVEVNVREGRGHSADQQDVWRTIAEKSRRLHASSPTRAMAAIYEQNRDGVEEYVRALNRPADNVIGALFVLCGKVVGFDAFDQPRTLEKLLPKLIRSTAIDALEMPASATVALERDRALGHVFLDKVRGMGWEGYPALGAGQEFRTVNPHLTGTALVAESKTVHLAAFRIDAPATA